MENKQLNALSRYVESTCGSLIGVSLTVLLWTVAGLPLVPVVAGCTATFAVFGMIDFYTYQKQR